MTDKDLDRLAPLDDDDDEDDEDVTVDRTKTGLEEGPPPETEPDEED
jgi:hypothetical protein